MNNCTGLYIHIPFCVKKCAYCDFYSTFADDILIDNCVSALKREITKWGGKLNRPIDTVYLGGGTPSLLGERIIPLLDTVRQCFDVTDDAEITAECNPSGDTSFLHFAKAAGVNRLSVGVQSGNDAMLKSLGRAHTVSDAKKYISAARNEGFDNISCDLMICLPDSTAESLSEDIDFILSLCPEHISAYMLKIENNTRFAKEGVLPLNDDIQANQYLYMCERLKEAGYSHYEISNFARSGFESRHNMKYWQLDDYLGIGPDAHSMINGKRFYYKRDLKSFISSPQTVFEGDVDFDTEYVMLKLRTADGANLLKAYGEEKAKKIFSKLESFKKAGLLELIYPIVRLTDNGMLLSNSIITEIVYENL